MENSSASEDTHSDTRLNEPGWERDALLRLAGASLNEQRRARRWGIFFKLLTFTYLLILLLIFADFEYEETSTAKEITALVDLQGVIFEGEEAGADNVIAGLRAAFKDDRSAGVVLRINSPGGSPVQSGYINDEITRLRKLYPKKPLYAVIADIAASGAYYVAAAADKIYADKASIVGSIGVRMGSFGFVDAMGKLGIERRLLTAGAHKALLDPFLPLSSQETQHVQKMLDELHQQFITAVKKGRGSRLAQQESLYSGLVWSGEESVKLGLVDGLGSAGYVARELVGAEEIVNFTKKRDWIDRFTDRIGTTLTGKIEARLLQPSFR